MTRPTHSRSRDPSVMDDLDASGARSMSGSTVGDGRRTDRDRAADIDTGRVEGGTDRDRTTDVDADRVETRTDRDRAAEIEIGRAESGKAARRRDDDVEVGTTVERRDAVAGRARWAARFGPIRWYAVLGAIAVIVIAGASGAFGAAVAIAAVDGPGGIGPAGRPARVAPRSSAFVAPSRAGHDEPSAPMGTGADLGGSEWSARSMAVLSAPAAVVATVTPPGGPTAPPPVATVTPAGDPPTPPVATITPVGAPPIFVVTVTPAPGGNPGTASPPPSTTPSSTPIASATGSPLLTPTAPATTGPTAGPPIGWIYLPIAQKNAEVGGP